MTTLTYICTDKNGNTFEVKTYAEAEKVKAEGGTYIRRYEEKRTYWGAHPLTTEYCGRVVTIQPPFFIGRLNFARTLRNWAVFSLADPVAEFVKPFF